MNVKLSASFNTPDAADRALARLRRSGVAFAVSRYSESQLRSGGAIPPGAVDITFPFTMIATNVTDASLDRTYAPMGARPLHEIAENGYGTKVNLQIKVPADQADRARGILKNSK